MLALGLHVNNKQGEYRNKNKHVFNALVGTYVAPAHATHKILTVIRKEVVVYLFCFFYLLLYISIGYCLCICIAYYSYNVSFFQVIIPRTHFQFLTPKNIIGHRILPVLISVKHCIMVY